MRTEPWPAPAVSVSAVTTPGATMKYALASGSVQIELKGKRERLLGSIERLEGELEFDPARLENSRGTVRADLSSSSFSAPGAASGEDSELTLGALRALELGPDRPSEERERDRWAIVRVIGFEAPKKDERANARTRAAVRAFAELTLHRFRVPVTLELDVELVPEAGGGAPELRVRTRRPLLVQLSAHDLVARDPAKSEAAGGSARAREGIREARVSAELSWTPRR